ncbi:MAG: hypothetical protein ABI855_01815 [Bacteroidota bacterium]
MGILVAGGSVADYFSIQPLRDKPLITEDEFQNLHRDKLTPFDNWALKQNPA